MGRPITADSELKGNSFDAWWAGSCQGLNAAFHGRRAEESR
jgi:hypothetical protein